MTSLGLYNSNILHLTQIQGQVTSFTLEIAAARRHPLLAVRGEREKEQQVDLSLMSPLGRREV